MIKRVVVCDIDDTILQYTAELDNIFKVTDHSCDYALYRYNYIPEPIINYVIAHLNEEGQFTSVPHAFETLNELSQRNYDIIFLSACGSGSKARDNRLGHLFWHAKYPFTFINVDTFNDKKCKLMEIIKNYDEVIVFDDRADFISFADDISHKTKPYLIDIGVFEKPKGAIEWKHVFKLLHVIGND